MNLVEQALTEHWGEKCDSYEQGCPVCDAWREYENLVTYGASATPDPMLEIISNAPPLDPAIRDAIGKMIVAKSVKPDYEETRHYILLKNLLIDIAQDRDAVRAMTTKKSMAEAVAAMKHLWV